MRDAPKNIRHTQDTQIRGLQEMIWFYMERETHQFDPLDEGKKQERLVFLVGYTSKHRLETHSDRRTSGPPF